MGNLVSLILICVAVGVCMWCLHGMFISEIEQRLDRIIALLERDRP